MTALDQRTRRVLASAFACHPDPGGRLEFFPGEAIGGWNLVNQISRFNRVWVLTHPQNRAGIERAQAEGKAPDAAFHYVALPPWINLLNKIEFGIRIYYYLWQRKALSVARELDRELRFDLAQHVTFNNDWMPSFIGAHLPVPFIWGPVGGGQRILKAFRREYSLGGSLAEITRQAAQWIGRNLLISRRRCMAKARAILVCNYDTRERIPSRYRSKVHLFPVNGIAAEDVDRERQWHSSGNSYRVLTAGRFIRLKAFDLAIRAFHLFLKEHPDAVFELAGKGPEEDRLRTLAGDLGILDKVRFIPWLSREGLMKRMSEADVFLFPSLRDGGGAVVVEAMARGTAVVCLDLGGPGFHVGPEWGIKISAARPDSVVLEMAQALSRLYLDKNLRSRIGRSARERALDYYVWDRLGDRLRAIHDEVLGAPGSE